VPSGHPASLLGAELMQPSCPWSSLAPSTSRFCEDAVCGIIREPANTWSNIGFLVAGIAMLRLGPSAPRLVKRFAFVCFFMGIGSAAFHATGTYVGGLLDTAGMQGVAAFMIAANARRLFPCPDVLRAVRRDATTFWTVAIAGTLLAYVFEPQARMLFALEVSAAGVMEICIVRRTRFRPAHRWLAASWVSFMAAYALWWLDLHRIGCDPNAHVLNGHVGWHLLMAGSLFCFQHFHVALGAGRRSPVRGPAAQASPARESSTSAPTLSVRASSVAMTAHAQCASSGPTRSE
jgi:hypothetical protein